MTASAIEQVLVVPTEVFHRCGYFQGFTSNTEDYLSQILDPEVTQYLPRDKMERDPSFKQLIPYCVFRHIDDTGTRSLFQYTRGKGQGESRLRSKCSIGIGGHVSTLDANEASPYDTGMRRELQEEVTIHCDYTQRCIGLINDDENEVGKVHLGVVHLIDVTEKKVTANEIDIADSGFETVESILSRIDQFETWSQICLNAVFQP